MVYPSHKYNKVNNQSKYKRLENDENRFEKS